MKTVVFLVLAAFLALPYAASAHRLDEYLQATLISIDNGRMHADIRLTPGVAVLPEVLHQIDTNGDGVVSPAEQRAYADKVLRDLSLSIDGIRLIPRLVSQSFPSIEAMQEGLGEIRLAVEADLPRAGSHRELTFENHHEFLIAAYLVNCLVPRDRHLHIDAQVRNFSQSSYKLDFTDASRPRVSLLSDVGGLTGTTALLLITGLTCLFRRFRASRILTGSES